MRLYICQQIAKIALSAFLVAACSNSSNQSASLATVVPSSTKIVSTAASTLTPTLTYTPTPTATYTPTPIPPTPTKTPIPEELNQLPLIFADADTSVVASSVVFQVTDVFGLSSIGDKTVTATTNQFLTIEAYIYNYSDSPVVVFNSDLAIMLV